MCNLKCLYQENLKKNGLELTRSGRIRTLSGTILSIEDAIARGLLEGINVEDLLSDTNTTPGVSTKSSSTQGRWEDNELRKIISERYFQLSVQ